MNLKHKIIKLILKSKDSGLTKHAERELRIAGLFDKNSDYNGMLGEAVLDMVRLFSMQGHGGYSEKQTLQLFSIVCNYKTLSPLTGKYEEWNEVGKDILQNNRDSAVFSNKIGARKPYYLDAIIWQK